MQHISEIMIERVKSYEIPEHTKMELIKRIERGRNNPYPLSL